MFAFQLLGDKARAANYIPRARELAISYLTALIIDPRVDTVARHKWTLKAKNFKVLIDMVYNMGVAQIRIEYVAPQVPVADQDEREEIILESGYYTNVITFDEVFEYDAVTLAGGEKQVGRDSFLDKLRFRLPDSFTWDNRPYSRDGIDSLSIPAISPTDENAIRLAAKREVAWRVSTGVLTGKTQLFAQAVLGNPDRLDITKADTIDGPRMKVAGETLDNVQGQTDGIIYANGSYWMIRLDWAGNTARARKMNISDTAQDLRTFIDENNVTTFSDLTKIEGYILSTATFSGDWFDLANPGLFGTVGGAPIAYGFQFTYSGRRADIIPVKENTYIYSGNPIIYSHTSTHVRVDFDEQEYDPELPLSPDNSPISVSVSVPGEYEWQWSSTDNIYVPFPANSWMRGLSRITLFPPDPAIGYYEGPSDAPFYCWFEADNEEPEIVYYYSEGLEEGVEYGQDINFSADGFLCEPGFLRLEASTGVDQRTAGFRIEGPTFDESSVDLHRTGNIQWLEIESEFTGDVFVQDLSFYQPITGGGLCPAVAIPGATLPGTKLYRHNRLTANTWRRFPTSTNTLTRYHWSAVAVPLNSSKGCFIGSSLDVLVSGNSNETKRIFNIDTIVELFVDGVLVSTTDIPHFWNALTGTVLYTRTVQYPEALNQWFKLCAPGGEVIDLHERVDEGEFYDSSVDPDPTVVNVDKGQYDFQIFERNPLVDPFIEHAIQVEAGVNGALAWWAGTNESFTDTDASGEFEEDIRFTGSPVGWQ